MTTKPASSKGVALAVAAFAVSLALGCGGGSPTGTRTSGRLPQAPATKSTPAAETGPLAGAMEIRLELPKDRYDVSDSVDVRIVFHNTGRVPLKIEYVVAPNVSGFAEFVVLGDKAKYLAGSLRLPDTRSGSPGRRQLRSAEKGCVVSQVIERPTGRAVRGFCNLSGCA
jgi:hypothetical protein